MRSPTRGLLRGLRAASLGLVGFSLALAAHVAAGGAKPGVGVLLSLAGLTGLAAVLLTGSRLSPVRVVMWLTFTQVVLHESFMQLSSPVGCALTGLNAPGGIHMGQGSQPVLDCAIGIADTGLGQGSVFASGTMVGAHVIATALMAALLAYGEKVLWFLAGWVRPVKWLRPGLPELHQVLVVPDGTPRMLRVRFDCGGVGRRGPPTRDLLASVPNRWRPNGSAATRSNTTAGDPLPPLVSCLR